MADKERYDDLEYYLKEQADSHKMYPSDFLWQNIQKQVHGEQRWPALTLLALLIVSALIIGSIVSKPVLKYTPIASTEIPLSKEASREGFKNYTDQLEPAHITKRTVALAVNSGGMLETVAISGPIASTDSIEEGTADKVVIAAIANNNVPPANAELIITTEHQSSIAAKQKEMPRALYFEDEAVDEYLNDLSANNTQAFDNAADSLLKQLENESHLDDNSIATAVILPAMFKRWELQFFITPSATYRKLVDQNNHNTEASNGLPLAPAYFVNVNEVVRHKPAMGLEIGATVSYKISRSLSVKSGLQLNVREYNIDAYIHSYEAASLSMENAETMKAYTRYRNVNGSAPVTLKNRYIEVSLPVGIDYTKQFSKRLAWGIGGTVQPTYIFDKQPFVISTDYKNYTEGSQFLRKWNINTSVETYVSYNLGKYRWQIGPQFRYQLLPSFANKYPIKEFLLDYGVKIGFTKTLR